MMPTTSLISSDQILTFTAEALLPPEGQFSIIVDLSASGRSPSGTRRGERRAIGPVVVESSPCVPITSWLLLACWRRARTAAPQFCSRDQQDAYWPCSPPAADECLLVPAVHRTPVTR
jgi:hypothetical protein